MNIITKNTHEGKFNLADAIINLDERINALEEAMTFFSNWYNKTQRVDILVPDHLAGNENIPKIIL